MLQQSLKQGGCSDSTLEIFSSLDASLSACLIVNAKVFGSNFCKKTSSHLRKPRLISQ
jgi:hypothetical protein